MSSRAKKTLILILIAVVMGSFGFYLGKRLKEKILSPPSQQASQTENIKQDNQQISSTVHASPYELIHPDIGPIIQTADISVTYSDDSASFTPTDSLKTKLRKNQNVMLFDQDGYILPLGGKINSISDKTITIALPKGTNAELLNTNLTIILEETNNIKRLPLDIIQQNDDGIAYIWRAKPHKTDEGVSFSASRYYIDAENSFKGEQFIEINHHISIDDFVILNPDQNVTENKRYRMSVVDLKRPAHNPIRQAWFDYEVYKQKKLKQEYTELKHNCNEGAYLANNPSQGDASYADSEPIIYKNDPMEIFNSLLDTHISSSNCAR